MLNIRGNIILSVVLGLLLFNHGFMQIRIGAIPLAEIAIVFFLITANTRKIAVRFSSVINPAPFFLWWMFGISSAFYYFTVNGIWALRDATNIIESLFILIGFSIFGMSKIRTKIIDKYPALLFLACVFALSYPLAPVLRELSPSISGGTGQEVSVLFSYANSSMMLLLGALYLVLNSKGKFIFERYGIYTAASILLFTIAAFQARTLYIQVAALIMILFFVKPQIAKQWVYLLFIAVILLLLGSFAGVEFEGRLGQKMSPDFLLNHFMTIFGIETQGLEGAAKGVGQRFNWWLDLYETWSENLTSMLFGLGFGFPLIDFDIAHGIAVREPHNSYISVLARSGLVGFSLWLWLHFSLLKAWFYSYSISKKVQWKKGELLLIVLFAYFVLVWCLALAEDGFEKPYNTVPYYFFWGVVVRVAWYAKLNLIGKNGIIN